MENPWDYINNNNNNKHPKSCNEMKNRAVGSMRYVLFNEGHYMGIK